MKTKTVEEWAAHCAWMSEQYKALVKENERLEKDVAFHADDAIALREEVRRLDATSLAKENQRLGRELFETMIVLEAHRQTYKRQQKVVEEARAVPDHQRHPALDDALKELGGDT